MFTFWVVSGPVSGPNSTQNPVGWAVVGGGVVAEPGAGGSGAEEVEGHAGVGLSDGGAHCGIICDASMPTYLLTHWARDRTRGDKLPLEWLVRRQTADNADFFGFADRGRLKPGMRADINVVDHVALRIQPPELVHDLPAGGRRLIQKVNGYSMTLVAGEPVFEKGEHTGALPGKLVRAGRS